MKKLLFLLAGLAIMTACKQTKPDPNPGPTPGGDPMINRTEATIKTLDTVHIFIANAPGEYTWTTTDPDMLLSTNEEYTVFQAYAFGEVTLSTEIDGKTYSCKVTINKLAEDKDYYSLPLLTWGATKEAVMAEAAKTGTFLEEVTEQGYVFVRYALNAPTIAPKGQLIEYMFDKNKLVQVMILAQYTTKQEASTAWVYTLERSFFYGTDNENKSLIHGMDRPNKERYFIYGETPVGEEKTPSLVMYFLEPPTEQSVSSKANTIDFVESPLAKELTYIAGPLTGIRTL